MPVKRSTVANLPVANGATIKEVNDLLVVPIRNDISRVEESIRDLRQDFKMQYEQTGAIIRAIADPITGYVPRSEHFIKDKALDERLDRIEQRQNNSQADTDIRINLIREDITKRAYSFSLGVLLALVAALANFAITAWHGGTH